MTLLNEQYNYAAINREVNQGKRAYACPDGSKLPSVTTILPVNNFSNANT